MKRLHVHERVSDPESAIGFLQPDPGRRAGR